MGDTVSIVPVCSSVFIMVICNPSAYLYLTKCLYKSKKNNFMAIAQINGESEIWNLFLILYLHFKCYPLSWLPYPCFYEGVLTFIHSLLPPHPCIPLSWGIQPSQEHGPLLLFMPDKATLCYICDWSHGSLHVQSLVGGLVPGSSGCSCCLIFYQRTPKPDK